jgi:hypothetical protein
MAWFLIILFILAGYHFVVEGIIVPSSRAVLRLRLFAIRDKLRSLRINEEIGEEEFYEGERRINNVIRLAPTIDLYTLARWAKRLHSDPELTKRIETRQALFEATANQEVQSLVNQACIASRDAFGFNSLGWLVYIIPLIAVALVYKKTQDRLVKLTSATPHELIYLEGACA